MKTTLISRLLGALVNIVAILVLFTSIAYAAAGEQKSQTPRERTLSIAYFSAKPTAQGVVLAWRTGPEANLAGFNLYRAEGAAAWVQVNRDLVLATGGSAEQNDYAWTDAAAKSGTSYYYVLEDVTRDGKATRHDPVRIKAGAPLRLGLDEVNGELLATLWPAVIGAVVAVGGFSLVQRRKR